MKINKLYESKAEAKADAVEKADNKQEVEAIQDAFSEMMVKETEEIVGVCEASHSTDEINEVLDDALYTAEDIVSSGSTEFPNVLFIGDAGIGKTQRVKKWAQTNGINLVLKQASGIEEAEIGGVLSPDETHTEVNKLPLRAFANMLNKPKTVLFLDEYNRAKPQIRTQLLTLINDHEIADESEDGGMKFLPNFLFTIMAINPTSYGGNLTELDPAERGRVRQVDLLANKTEWLRWFSDYTTFRLNAEKDLKKRADIVNRYQIAKTLVNSKEFNFDDPQTVLAANDAGAQATSSRNLTRLLDNSRSKPEKNNDDGEAWSVKDDFLSKWKGYCNPDSEVVNTVEDILAGYADIDDKANSVFKKSEDELFGNDTSSAAAKLQKKAAKLNK